MGNSGHRFEDAHGQLYTSQDRVPNQPTDQTEVTSCCTRHLAHVLNLSQSILTGLTEAQRPGSAHRASQCDDVALFEDRRGHLDWARLAEEEYKARRAREAIFKDFGIFAEPGWDMLLDLMIAEHRGKRLSISSVCIGSGVPATTALRWLSLLEGKGLVYKEHDPRDARRSFVRLSDQAIDLMRKTLLEKSRQSRLAA